MTNDTIQSQNGSQSTAGAVQPAREPTAVETALAFVTQALNEYAATLAPTARLGFAERAQREIRVLAVVVAGVGQKMQHATAQAVSGPVVNMAGTDPTTNATGRAEWPADDLAAAGEFEEPEHRPLPDEASP